MTKANTRKKSVHGELTSKAEELLRLTEKLSGISNKDSARLKDEITRLIEKWK